METTSGPRLADIVRFGTFELSLRSGELRRRGLRVALQEQPLRILMALLERPGEVVTREDLCRRLWPEGTFVDFEHSLNAAVRRLRVTLGDDADVPRFVETVHKRGYRFLPLGRAHPYVAHDAFRNRFGARHDCAHRAESVPALPCFRLGPTTVSRRGSPKKRSRN